MIYFTLRACWDPGAKSMPACRDKLVRGNQRTRLVGGIVAGPGGQGGANGEMIVETPIQEETDRLAAYLLRAQAGAARSAPDPKGSGGGGGAADAGRNRERAAGADGRVRADIRLIT